MSDKIECPYCLVKISKAGISRHIKRKHNHELEEKFKCKSCNKLHNATFASGQFCSKKCSNQIRGKITKKITDISLKDISKNNTFTDGKYHCPECNSSYTNYSKLTTHIFKKHVKKTGLCEKCGIDHDSSFGIGRFCSVECANSKEHSIETKKKISKIYKMNLTYSIDILNDLKISNKYKYSYIDFLYKNGQTILNIKCEKHGIFNLKYDTHKKGIGCKKCYEEERLKCYIKASNIAHKYKYDYSKTKLSKRLDKKTIIKCPKHGLFSVHAHSHLYGFGCKKCANEKKIIPFNELIEDSYKLKYIFHEDTYINGSEKMKITCKKCKNTFFKRPISIIEGSGCDICYPPHYGFNKSKKGFLYYIRIDINNETYYKIGITNLSVKKRFSEYERNFMTILKIEEFKIGLDAYKKEQSILKKYKQFQYKGEKILETGNTELFIYDVLNLD